MTAPVVDVVTVVTSTGPSPKVTKFAAESTTGLLLPSLIIVIVTVPFTPAKVITDVLPASLLTVMTPAVAVASAEVLLASPCAITVTVNGGGGGVIIGGATGATVGIT